MKGKLKAATARFIPETLQHRLREWRHLQFLGDQQSLAEAEPDLRAIESEVPAGGIVLDIGANTGIYTIFAARLVGPEGFVIALEPIPSTFAILANAVSRLAPGNVALLNAAAGNERRFMHFHVPMDAHGRPNFYRAHASESGTGVKVWSMRVDDLNLAPRVHLIKVDAEGADYEVISGAEQLIARDRPALLVEDHAIADHPALKKLEYEPSTVPNSPNLLLRVARRAS